MSLATVLLTIGPVALVAGATVALNVRGSADGLERWATGNQQRAMHARGDLGPPERVPSAQFYRYLATLIGFGGLVFTLGGLLELA
ncbi:hypothetical protein ACIBEA_01920 [Streptomyces sp. NPDC051555]|uniref:hypothetical protein n=1 Tax=Streptomyces sp. NPDC051555 TaxID=3365657 RepID=UPI0037BBD0A0